MLKTIVLLNIFVETTYFFVQDTLMKVQKNNTYLKYKSFCNIINVFTVTFGHFTTSLLN